MSVSLLCFAALNSLGLSRSGMMRESDVKQTLKRLGLPATDENATAMLKHLGMDGEGYVSYGQFRNFLMLLPRDVATAKDPSVLWFEASTMVQINPPEAARSATVKLAIQAARSPARLLLALPLLRCTRWTRLRRASKPPSALVRASKPSSSPFLRSVRKPLSWHHSRGGRCRLRSRLPNGDIRGGMQASRAPDSNATHHGDSDSGVRVGARNTRRHEREDPVRSSQAKAADRPARKRNRSVHSGHEGWSPRIVCGNCRHYVAKSLSTLSEWSRMRS